MALNAALAMASRSLEVFSAGIQVAGQNIANAATPGYIREELTVAPSPPSVRGLLIIGSGVGSVGIRLQLDRYLETRIHAANTQASASAARNTVFKQLEAQLNEFTSADLSSSLNQFLGALGELAAQPDSVPARQLAIRQGQQLASDIVALRAGVDQLRVDQSGKVSALVAEANDLIDQIHRLNPQISRLEAAGLLQSDAGALRTQRYNALNRLSEIIPIRYIERADGQVDLFSGSDYLLLGDQVQHLTATPYIDRGQVRHDVTFSATQSPVSTSGGELAGVIQARDDILGGFIDQLDRFTSTLIREFNRWHSSGEGLAGFTSVAGTQLVLDPSAPLSSSGLAFPAQHGSFVLKVTNQATDATVSYTVPIDLDGIDPVNDTSLNSLRDWINANVPIASASISPDGILSLDAAGGYELRFADDTSGVLTTLGINTFFAGTASDSIRVNPVLVADHRLLATGQGGGPADGSNALRLAGIATTAFASLDGQTLDAFYDGILTAVAQGSSSEQAASDAYRDLVGSLRGQREQTSGVSLDEEAVRILEFQRAFQASARLMSTIDELYEVLLNI